MKRIITVRKIAAVLLCFFVLGIFAGCSSEKKFKGNLGDVKVEPGDTYVIINVRGYGEIVAKLFPEAAPVGVEQFVKAAESGYYDGKTFHRVLEGMLIQGGALNTDGSDSSIPPSSLFDIETSSSVRSFNGALCFAADRNGKNYRQFYIVSGSGSVDIDEIAKNLKAEIDEKSDLLLKEAKQELNDTYKALTKIPDAVKERYKEQGGLFQLDDTVTIFGQVIQGFDVLEKIQKVEVVAGNRLDDTNEQLGGGEGQNSRPLDDIFIESVTIVVMPTEEETEEETTTKKKAATTAASSSDETSSDTTTTDSSSDETSSDDTTTSESDTDEPLA